MRIVFRVQLHTVCKQHKVVTISAICIIACLAAAAIVFQVVFMNTSPKSSGHISRNVEGLTAIGFKPKGLL